jgi:hypothetical protein
LPRKLHLGVSQKVSHVHDLFSFRSRRLCASFARRF